MTRRVGSLVMLWAWAVVAPSAAQNASAQSVAVEGRWEGAIRTPASYSPIDISFEFKRTDNELGGVAWPGTAAVPLKNLVRTGDTLAFEVNGPEIVYTFRLTAYADRLEGEVDASDHGHTWKGTVTVTRAPAPPAVAGTAPQARQPVYVSLFTAIDDQLNIELSEERLARVLDLVQRQRAATPGVSPSCLILFSGAAADALQARDTATGLVTRTRAAAKTGAIDLGYDGTEEPTFVMRPRPNLRNATTGAARWLARSDAARWFLTEFKDPVVGDPDPSRSGGLKREIEVFGPPVFATGLTLELGGDPEVTHLVRAMAPDAVLAGLPENTVWAARRLHGFGASAAGIGRFASPAPGMLPEVFWMDNMLRLSDTSGAPVKVFAAHQGPEALQKLLESLDRSKPHVIRVQVGHPAVYMKPGFANDKYSTPLAYAYDFPKASRLVPDGLQPRDAVDAAFAREDATVGWLATQFFAANPGSRFLAISELKRAAANAEGPAVPVSLVKAAASDLLARWEKIGTYPPSFAAADGRYFSLADMFHLCATVLAARERLGDWPQSVVLRQVYGPFEMTDETGDVRGPLTAADVARAATGLADALNDTAWKPVPANVVPTWVALAGGRVNAAQFLRLMAGAVVAPAKDARLGVAPSFMFSPDAEAFPKSRRREDTGALWTLKPAALTGLR